MSYEFQVLSSLFSRTSTYRLINRVGLKVFTTVEVCTTRSADYKHQTPNIKHQTSNIKLLKNRTFTLFNPPFGGLGLSLRGVGG